MSSESLVYLSYHNVDIAYACRLAALLIRYYRDVWLDRFEIAPREDWPGRIQQARAQASHAVVVVSDEYLASAYCRAEFESFQERDLPVIAVIPRDFSTATIADLTFSDWIDCRRWFDDPKDLSVENLLSQLPQSDTAQSSERGEYLRGLIQELELSLARLPSAWTSLQNADAPGASDIRPRAILAEAPEEWEFLDERASDSRPARDLYDWAATARSFALRGNAGSGKTTFAQLLALSQAHEALRDDAAACPVWLDLALWEDERDSLEAFMDAHWTPVSYWRHWLESNPACLYLDNWGDFAARRPERVAEVTQWIDSSPEQRFVVLAPADPRLKLPLPSIRIQPVTVALAQRYAARCLTLEQANSFRQILPPVADIVENSGLDFLSIGLELLAADRALAVNQWTVDPMPALIRKRHQLFPGGEGLDAGLLVAELRRLAWAMTLGERHRFVERDSTVAQALDAQVIERALELGLLSQSGERLRFGSAAFQWHLAADRLEQEGLDEHIKPAEFSASHGRVASKWDSLAQILVDRLRGDQRKRYIEQIADIDPFLALQCLRRHPSLMQACRESLVLKLVDLRARNPAAQPDFRAAMRCLPDSCAVAELLINQLPRFDNPAQLWLWREARALPLDLPVDFVQFVQTLERDQASPLRDLLGGHRLSLALAFLVKLSRQGDESLRRNAIWLLGELQYMPIAVLLLDDLEDPECADHAEVLRALTRFAHSDLLLRVLQWSEARPEHRPALIEALAERKRLVTSRLLALADARRLTLSPQFNDAIAEMDERDIAIGLARIAADHAPLPSDIERAIAATSNAAALHERVASLLKHLPNRAAFEQLLDDISAVLRDPPEATVIAGSSLDALLFGQRIFGEASAHAETPKAEILPDALVRQLGDASWQVRARALGNLPAYPARVALPHLLAASDDDDSRARLQACGSLARFESEITARKALLAALADEDAGVVAGATALLKSLPGLDCDAIAELLESENQRAVAAAIEILAEARHQAAVPELRRLLQDQREPEPGGPAIGDLARAALQLLEGASFQDAGQESTSSDSEAGQYSDEEKLRRALQVLRDDDWGRAQKAAKFLRRFARHLRGGDNPRILALLCDALRDELWSLRWAAAEALAMLQDREAIPALSARLNDPSWIVQVAATRSLVALGAAETASRMLPALASPHKTLREATAEALGELRCREAIPALERALKRDADEFVRLAALQAIVDIDPDNARPYLEIGLSDPYPPLRLTALRNLAPQMDERDLPILRQLLGDDAKPALEELSPRDLAVLTLQRINSAECRELLEAASGERAGA